MSVGTVVTGCVACVTLTATLAARPANGPSGQVAIAVPAARAEVPMPVFTDPDRRVRLARAFPEIDRIVGEAARAQGWPGAVLGVIVDGELAHLSLYGVQDVESRRPVTADSVFRIASMTKSVTALAILRLRQAGRLSLDDPVERHVPEFAGVRLPTSDSPRITIRHLLTHAEGFPEDNPWGDRQLARSEQWLTDALRAGIPFSTVPGTAFEYSNYGYAILGRVVSRAAGVPYERFVQQEILEPLGMTASSFEAAAIDPAVRTQGYGLVDGRLEPLEPLGHGSFGAMGGLWTSARDLARYVAYLMSAHPPRDGPDTGPVGRDALREMQVVARQDTTRVTRPALDAPMQLAAGGYGYGLRISEDCVLGTVVGHGGGLPGYGSLMRWLPERGVGLIAMSNVTYARWSDVFGRVFEALRATGGLEPRKAPPSSALRQAAGDVTSLVLSWDDGLAHRVAADNLFLDVPAARRRAAIAALVDQLGPCEPAQDIEPENALRGMWRLPCTRGWLEVRITLAPTMPPTVQYLDVRGVRRPEGTLAKAIAEVVSLIQRWDEDAAARTITPGPALDAFRRQAQLARLLVGTCRAGDVLSGTTSRVAVRLDCERGAVVADLAREDAGDRLASVVLAPDRRQACVP